jgi:quercetin dioxygenase-like cupin family protein
MMRSDMPLGAVMIPAGGGESLDLGRACPRVLLAGDECGGNLAVLETAQPSGGGPPLHTHTNEDESFYVLEGEFTFVCGEVSTDAAAGSFAHLPRGVPHRYVAGPDGGRLLMLFTPSGMENYFREWAGLVAAGQMSDSAMEHLAADHGLQLGGSYLRNSSQP